MAAPRHRASVVIPAHNEQESVGATVAAAWGLPPVGQVIVVDDGSADGTAVAAARAGAMVVRRSRCRGKGSAMALGLSYVTGEVVLFLDADLGETAAHTGPLVAAVSAGQADMAVAVFAAPKSPGRQAGGFGLVVGLAHWGVYRCTGRSLRAPLSGQRAVGRRLLSTLTLAPGFGVEVGLGVDVLLRGGRILELPLPLGHRRTGRDLRGFAHRARQFRDVAWCLAGRLLARREGRAPAGTDCPDPVGR